MPTTFQRYRGSRPVFFFIAQGRKSKRALNDGWKLHFTFSTHRLPANLRGIASEIVEAESVSLKIQPPSQSHTDETEVYLPGLSNFTKLENP